MRALSDARLVHTGEAAPICWFSESRTVAMSVSRPRTVRRVSLAGEIPMPAATCCTTTRTLSRAGPTVAATRTHVAPLARAVTTPVGLTVAIVSRLLQATVGDVIG